MLTPGHSPNSIWGGLILRKKSIDLITLALKPTPQQQANLEQLLTEQQDRSSPNYHRWLTPEQYAERFGLSPGDIGKVKAWLESQRFAVTYVARGRNWLTFSGTAAQVSKVFRVEIHRYAVDGEIHFANATEPSIPASLEPLVLGVLGLDDFLRKPRTLPENPDSSRMMKKIFGWSGDQRRQNCVFMF